MLALRGDCPMGERRHHGRFQLRCRPGRNLSDDQMNNDPKSRMAGSPQGHNIPGRRLEADIAVRETRNEDSGADCVMAQLCWDMEQFKYWLDAIRKAGVTMPVDVGVMPILDQAVDDQYGTVT